ncbi:MAG: hypothetical protein AB7T59_08800 [Hyphomonadaceae bacterium]
MRAIFIAAAIAALAACSQETTTTETPDTTAEAPAPAPAAPTVVVLTEPDARAQIEAAGYTNVTGLTQNPDGSWSATGTRDGATTQLTIGEGGVQVVTTPTP